MNLIENFTASFKYLFTNGSVFCVMGILFILSNIANFNNTINLLKSGNLILFNSGIDLSNGIFLIISFISAIFIIGYCLSIIKTTLDGLDKLPKLNFKSMFIGGIKSIVVLIVYIIIAAIILAIIGYCTGIFDLIAQINVQLVSNVNSTAIPVM